MKVLVTGCAGFIGYHVAEALIARGDDVVGLDNLNDYYDIRLKRARLDRLHVHPGFEFRPVDVSDKEAVGQLVLDHADVVASLPQLLAGKALPRKATSPNNQLKEGSGWC